MAGELGYDTGPFVNAALFCETAIQGNDQVLSLIRVIDIMNLDAQGPDAPDEIPPGTIARTTLVVILKAGQARGAQRLEITLERPDGIRKSAGESAVNFSAGDNGGVNAIVQMQIEVVSAGLYWADVSINKRLMTRVPLQINYAFRRPPAAE